VKIDGIAASAASVIAMAGTTVLMSPVSMLMIHNPATFAFGDTGDMKKAIEMLNEVKESIINAYELKTGLSRAKISHLMDSETWMNAYKAVELGFADDILFRNADVDTDEDEDEEKLEIGTEPEEEPKTPNPNEEEDEDEKKTTPTPPVKQKADAMIFSRKATDSALMTKISKHYKETPATPTNKGRSVNELMERLNLMKR